MTSGYAREYSFAGFQANSPQTPLPGQKVDEELDNVASITSTLASSLDNIRRSDGKLKNGIVTREALAPDVITGVNPAELWVTPKQYFVNDTVFYSTGFYRALQDHVSGVFSTDLASGKWVMFAEFSFGDAASLNVGTVAGTVMAGDDSRVVAGVTGVADRTLLKALPTTLFKKVFLEEAGREGFFLWKTGDFSAQVAADTQEGLYVKANGIAATVGCWVRVTGLKYIVEWWGAKGDGSTLDTVAIQAAFNALPQYATLVFGPSRYKTNGVIECQTDNISVEYNNSVFLVGDTGTAGTISDTNSGKIGYLFRNNDNLSLTGVARFYGQGTVGTTSLCGVVFDTCTNLHCLSVMHFDTMACGQFFISCSNYEVADVFGDKMDGLQTFESPPTNTAGSLQVFVGCSHFSAGDASGKNMDKPVRYFSVGTGVASNSNFKVGATRCVGKSGSDLAHAIGLRSAVDGCFGPVIIGANSIAGVLAIQYAGDQALGFKIDRVFIESVTGTSPATPSSVDAAVIVESQDTGPIGTITVGNLDAKCDALAGLYVTGGKLVINSARLSGAATRLIYVASSSASWRARLSIGKLTVRDNSGPVAPINIGKGGQLDIGNWAIESGPGTNAIEGIRYDNTIGNAGHSGHYGVTIDTITYDRNGHANDYGDIIFDSTHSFEKWNVRHIDGVGSTGAHALFGSTNRYFFKNGRVLKSAIPTELAHSVGTVLWNSATAAGGTPGWVCTTAGTPGTWKAMANVAA